MPTEYLELTMSRIYQCPPTALKGVPVVTMYRHLSCLAGEQDYREGEEESTQGGANA
jgi:hypothetical protein